VFGPYAPAAFGRAVMAVCTGSAEPVVGNRLAENIRFGSVSNSNIEVDAARLLGCIDHHWRV
jgi:hypothetical protein